MNRDIPQKEILVKLYSKGLSMKDIGDILGCSAGKIYKYMHIYKIEVREWGSKSEFAKKKISIANKGNKTTLGRKMPKAQKKKLSESHLKKGVGHKKKRSDGYISIYFPDHPKSCKDGYIMEHDLVMECFIGRWLKEDEIVHHKNKKRDDNRIENLQLMTFKEHASLHMKERHQKRRNDLSIE